MKKPIVLFGSGPYLAPVLDMLLQTYEIPLVITTEKESHHSIPAYCKKNNINFISVENVSDEIIEKIAEVKAEVAVLAYFGVILPKDLLDIFSKGIINIHPSLLPKYRGTTPGQTALLNGDTTTGITIIKLDEEVDHGPILVSEQEPIYPTDTAESLYKRLFKISAGLLSQYLAKYLRDELKLTPQDDAVATFTPRHLTKKDGYIDINNPPDAIKLDHMIRAYYPWPGTWIKISSFEFPISNSQLIGKIIKLLPNQMIQVEGKKPMSYKDFVNGYKEGKEILRKLNL